MAILLSRTMVTSLSPWQSQASREGKVLSTFVVILVDIVCSFAFHCNSSFLSIETSQMDLNKRILLLSHPKDRSEDIT